MIYYGIITMKNGVELPFELYPEDAPHTIENFIKLVREGYYDDETSYRVIKNFVPQDGCPYGTGTGDLGYTIPCGAVNNPRKHEDGSLFTTRRGKNTGCCQFFICHCPQPCLGGIHTVFGKVTDNLGTVRNMRNDDVMKKMVIRGVQGG